MMPVRKRKNVVQRLIRRTRERPTQISTKDLNGITPTNSRLSITNCLALSAPFPLLFNTLSTLSSGPRAQRPVHRRLDSSQTTTSEVNQITTTS